jgi:hypothetical protein
MGARVVAVFVQGPAGPVGRGGQGVVVRAVQAEVVGQFAADHQFFQEGGLVLAAAGGGDVQGRALGCELPEVQVGRQARNGVRVGVVAPGGVARQGAGGEGGKGRAGGGFTGGHGHGRHPRGGAQRLARPGEGRRGQVRHGSLLRSKGRKFFQELRKQLVDARADGPGGVFLFV